MGSRPPDCRHPFGRRLRSKVCIYVFGKRDCPPDRIHRIRNKAKLRPIDLADPRNTEMRSMLQKAEFAMQAGDDVIAEDDDDNGGGGSASDSE